MNTCRSLGITATAILLGAVTGLAAAQNNPAAGPEAPQFEGYDFSQQDPTIDASSDDLIAD